MELNDKSKKAIEKSTGLKFSQIQKLNALEVEKEIEKKIKKKLSVNEKFHYRLSGRGSVYLYLRKFLHFSNLDKEISKI